MTVTDDQQRYEQAVAFLYGRLNYERLDSGTYGKNEFKLDTMHELLSRLGNPHHQLKIVHIAGTKGKGSTSQFMSAILTAAGYRTGCYTSPHLLKIEERFALNGAPCTARQFIELVDHVRPVVEQLDAEAVRSSSVGPTFFEVTTAMAFLHFAKEKTDWVVLEVGLGGRLDSTNVCQPELCIITTISFDHMRQLGNTLTLIAGEKAGIIKEQVPVITGVTQEEPWSVIRDIAASHHAPLLKLGRDFDYVYHAARWKHQPPVPTMDYYRIQEGKRTVVASSIELSAWGEHQALNATLAWTACELLQKRGVAIEETAIRHGLRTAHCPGRVEILAGEPVVLMDTAHNAASIEALTRALQESFPQKPKGLVLAATQGKDVAGMLHSLVQEFDVMVCTRYLENPRGMTAEELTRHARRIATAEGSLIQILTADTPLLAWKLIREKIPAEGLICVTGSFFLAAEIRALQK